MTRVARCLGPMLVFGAVACSVEIDWGGAQFTCDDGHTCPPEFLCVAQHCVPRIDASLAGGDGGIDADPTLCGNGAPDPGEECDDGNNIDSDLCVQGCRIARCGDGYQRTSVEECDDGNTSAGDLCNPICRECTSGAARFTWTVSDACFTRFDGQVSWDTAAQNCAQTGAHLAIFETRAESDAVATGLGQSTSQWIGLSDRDTEGAFVWVNGLALALAEADWATSEPNGDTAENCVGHTSGGNWSDYDCAGSTSVPGYICEDEGWLIGPDGHAYRFLTQRTSWSLARDVCQALGGHLATVNSAVENTLVASRVKAETFLGGDDMTSQGDYLWLTGEDVTYENWSTGEPSDTLGAQDCVSIQPDGRWTDTECAGPLAYVCEVE